MMEIDYEFTEGDKVLVYYGELLYEGKILKRRITDSDGIQYYIHYKGFNSRWDQWIGTDAVLAHNEINLGHMQRVKTRYYNSKNAKSIPAASNKNKCIEQLMRKRGRPKKTIDKCKNDEDLQHDSTVLSAEHDTDPATEYSAEQATVQTAENDAVQAADHADTVQAPELADTEHSDTEHSDTEHSDTEHSDTEHTDTEHTDTEHTDTIEAVSNAVICVAPFWKSLELNVLKIPLKMRNILICDFVMNSKYNKMIKFADTHYIAQVIHSFHKSCNFADNHIKPRSFQFCVTLLQYFNEVVHQHLLYENEQLYRLKNKGISHFRERYVKQPSISYVFKNCLTPKKVWCYVYGPRYLLRLLVNLPKIVSSMWEPQCDIDFFVENVNALLEFLEANCDTYFSDNDYYA